MRKIELNGPSAVAVALLASLAASGCVPRSADADAPPTQRLAPAQLMSIGSTVLSTGVIRPQVGAEVAVGSRVSGVLRRQYVTIGDRVESGQLWAELDHTEFEARHFDCGPEEYT